MKKVLVLFCIMLGLFLVSCSNDDVELGEIQDSLTLPDEQENPRDPDTVEPPINEEDDRTPTCLKTLYIDHLQPSFFSSSSCKKATSSQIKEVNEGNLKKDQFLARCYQETSGSCWCNQVIRPNPKSIDTFFCTYGNAQVHQLIHPKESTWKYAIEAVKIVEEFEKINLRTEIIYNWWRPEPYNKNVSGSPTRHPHGTSVDVRFKTKSIQDKAFSELCKMRKSGRIRAIGYYATTAIHFGVGDNRANTWGKSCP